MEPNIPLDYMTSLADKKLTMVLCRQFNQSSDIWILDEHAHNHLELIYFLTGEAQIKTTTGETSLTLYDVLVHPSGVNHREFVDLHKRQEIVNIGIEVDTDFNISDSFVLKDSTGNLRRIFRMLYYHYTNDGSLNEEIISQLLSLLLLYLTKSAAEQPSSEYSLIDQLVEYVQENYMNELTVKDLADYIHVSESYLSRLMSSKIGISPMKYVNSVRIENAKLALKNHLSVEQIALLAGYKDSKYFSTAFKKEVGISPSQYRKILRLQ